MRNANLNISSNLGTVTAACPVSSVLEMIEEMGLELVTVEPLN